MPNGEQRYRENIKALESLGVRIEGPASPNPDALSTHENPAIEAPELALRGLQRVHAIILFRELNQFLNPGFEDENILAQLELMDEESLAELDREDFIEIETPEASDFNIQIHEEEPSKLALEIRRGQLDEDLESLRLLISRTFLAVMSSANLVQATLDPEVATSQAEVSAETIEKPSSHDASMLSLRARTSKSSRPRLLTTPEKKQFHEDLEEIRFVLEVLGIEDLERADDDKLVEFWRSRHRDHIAVVDLFMHVVIRKQEIEGSSAVHRNYVNDLYEYGKKENDPIVLRRKLEDRAIDTYTKKLNVSPEDIKPQFQIAANEHEKLKLRLVAWFAEQPVMIDYRRKIRSSFKHENSRVFYNELYDHLINHIRELGNEHVKTGESDNWGDVDALDYDREITFENDVYNRKLNYFRNSWLLAAYVLSTKNIDELLKR